MADQKLEGIKKAENENRNNFYSHIKTTLSQEEINEYQVSCQEFEFNDRMFGGSKSKEVF